jgi:hypothetical protein
MEVMMMMMMTTPTTMKKPAAIRFSLFLVLDAKGGERVIQFLVSLVSFFSSFGLYFIVVGHLDSIVCVMNYVLYLNL